MVFDDEVFDLDVGRYRTGSRVRGVADQARRDFLRGGIPRAELMACSAEGRDGTRLAGAFKVYLPISGPDRRFGMVFLPVLRQGNELALVFLAFGIRHQPAGSHAPTVYGLAHRRRHGRSP